jgi:hypothetical protein
MEALCTKSDLFLVVELACVSLQREAMAKRWPQRKPCCWFTQPCTLTVQSRVLTGRPRCNNPDEGQHTSSRATAVSNSLWSCCY